MVVLCVCYFFFHLVSVFPCFIPLGTSQFFIKLPHNEDETKGKKNNNGIELVDGSH